MKPWETLARAHSPDGTELVLARRDKEVVVRAGGHLLMSSRQHGSEEKQAELGCAGLRETRAARVLVGGLGLGYTLRATLDRLGPDAEVTVAELIPELVEWNRGILAPMAGRPLDDKRVRVVAGDVFDILARSDRTFDAILLDVDNGPSALTSLENARLYDNIGLELLRSALKSGGVAVVWSAGPDSTFSKRLAGVGMRVKVEPASAVATEGRKRGAKHVLFVATRVG